MAAGVCVCCQRRAQHLEEQHLAGRVNHPFTVPVCVKCHQLLTFRQRAGGVPLAHDLPAGPTRELLAIIDGVMDLLAVAAERRPKHSPVPTANWRRGSRVLHLLFAEDGFRPDPRVPTLPAFPQSGTPRRSDELHVAAKLAPMLQILAHQVPGTPQVWRDLADRAATLEPAALDEVFAAALDPDWFARLVEALNGTNRDLIALALAAEAPSLTQFRDGLQRWSLVEQQGTEMAQRILNAMADAT